jgi:hypothetical protein
MDMDMDMDMDMNMDMNTDTDTDTDTENFIQNKGQYQTSVNGNIIDNTQWNMVYDGNELDLEANRNNETIYINLNNDDIMKLLAVPAYHKSIHERLNDDLHSNNTNDVQPIIVEETEKHDLHKNTIHLNNKTKKTSKHTSKSKSKSKSKSNSKSKNKSKSNSKSKNKNKSKSNNKNKSKSKSKSKNKSNSKIICPDISDSNISSSSDSDSVSNSDNSV